MHSIEQILRIMKKAIKIYILDDNEYFGTMLKDKISNKNRVVEHFRLEMDFIRRLKDKPDVIILDHKLENCTGLEILEIIKRKCGTTTHVIYLSGQEYLNVMLKALRNGALEYVEKGITPLSYIDNIIDKISKHSSHFTESINVNRYRSDSRVY